MVHSPTSRAERLLRTVTDLPLLLPAGAAFALVWANTAADSYQSVAHALRFAVNDVLMAFFFGLAAKEVAEATVAGGALDSRRKASLPVVAAIGGMIGPALLYVALAHWWRQPQLVRGWAIPCATDIAFSYLVAKAIFRRDAPAIPFLLLLAIADDALGLIVLAVFYPVGELHLVAGGALMAASLGASFALRRRGTLSPWPYLAAGGTLSWAALHVGGLHPALALVPVIPFLPHAGRDPGLFVDAPPDARDTLSQFERHWKYPVQGVLFLFGLANAGVPLRQAGAGAWIVLLSILAGKPIGIGLTVAAAVGAGLRLPRHLVWRDVVVVGFTAAIGFTVALFFATAAFPIGQQLDETKMGALLSVASALVALAVAKALGVGRMKG